MRLLAVIEREGMSDDRERISRYAVNAIVPEVMKIVTEEVRMEKRRKVEVMQ